MNKKGLAILLLAAIGFLVAVALFFSTVNKVSPVGNSTFLGETESQIFDTYVHGESLVTFLENSARLASEKDDFSAEFSKYLGKANKIFGTDLDIGDYSFEITESSVRAVYSRLVVLEGSGVKYSFYPNFVIRL